MLGLLSSMKKKKSQSTKAQTCRIPFTHAERAVTPPSEPAGMHEITWRIFRIMAEFVEGFEFLSKSNREVTIFGSARLPEDNKWYQEARKLGEILSKEGFSVITGGGPGIMRAANKGATEANTVSVGLRAGVLINERIDDEIFTHDIDVKYLLIRRFAMSMRSHALVFFPGGYGTLNEVFEFLVLIQVELYEPVPFVFVGSEFWSPMVSWMKDKLVREGAISEEDLDLFIVEDDVEKIVVKVDSFVKNHSKNVSNMPLWNLHK